MCITGIGQAGGIGTALCMQCMLTRDKLWFSSEKYSVAEHTADYDFHALL